MRTETTRDLGVRWQNSTDLLYYNLMKTLRSLAFGVVTAATVLMPFAASAQVAQPGSNPFGSGGFVRTANNTIQSRAGLGSSQKQLPEIVGNIINIVLGFLGVLLLLYLLYAGFLWMTAGGEDKKTKEAQQYIQNAVIGLIIILASFAISNFVITNLTAVTAG